MKNKNKQINMQSKRINIKQFLILIMFVFTITSCTEEYTTDHTPTAYWNFRTEDAIVINTGYNHSINILFGLSRDEQTIFYEVDEVEWFECPDSTYGKTISYNSKGNFEIDSEFKPFSEWNECNVKFPIDTTKSWLFRFEGKNIPNNISFLYDTKNNVGDTLIFWDSDTTKYYFIKQLIY